MKMKKYLLVSLLLIASTFSNAQITLETCRQSAQENYPLLKQSELFEQITALKINNIKNTYLPQLNLNAQATLQSDVTSIELPPSILAMGLDLEPVSIDQYKLYIDIKQNIWDGGVSKSQKQIEQQILKTNQKQLQTELFQLNQAVDAYYFGALQLNQQVQILKIHKSNLSDSFKKAQLGFKNGIIKEIQIELLNVEVLKLKQQITTLQAKYGGLLRALSVLTGIEIEATEELSLPNSELYRKQQNLRPELELMTAKQKQISASNHLISSTRKPKVFGFGQLGYGRPGFNMLSNDFKTFGIIGIGASWKILDYQQTNRQLKINQINQSIIDTKKDEFLKQNKSKQMELLSQIEALELLLSTDTEIIQLQESIASRSQTEFENGTMSTNDYLKSQNALSIAQLNKESHKIQKAQLITAYNNLFGL